MARRFVPGVTDAVFGLVLLFVLIGGRHGLLNDPGTLWHLRLGREIVASGQIPRVDSLTYSREGSVWVDQSWLFDVGLATVVDRGGWSLAIGLAAIGLAAIYAWLARGQLREGTSPAVALVVVMIAAGIGAIHFLIRPHLFTLAFFLITLQLCRDQHERGGWRVLWTVPLMVVWANLHGGFLAGPVVVFSAAIGHAVSGNWDTKRRREVGTFLLAGVLCLAAATVNPYGFGLYGHVGRLLVSSGVTDLIDEYQPIPFGKPTARSVEAVVLMLIALPTLTSRRMGRYDLVQSLVWLHLSLASVRNVPLFALANASGLCRLVDPKSPEIEGSTTPVERISVWPLAVSSALLVGVALGLPLGGFDPEKWPFEGMKALNLLPSHARLFHEQDWGGLVEAESRPMRKAFVDDRFELFGRPMLLKYINALEGGPDWDNLESEYHFVLVWLRPDRGLTRRLEKDPRWCVRHRDAVSVLFERVGAVMAVQGTGHAP